MDAKAGRPPVAGPGDVNYQGLPFHAGQSCPAGGMVPFAITKAQRAIIHNAAGPVKGVVGNVVKHVQAGGWFYAGEPLVGLRPAKAVGWRGQIFWPN